MVQNADKVQKLYNHWLDIQGEPIQRTSAQRNLTNMISPGLNFFGNLVVASIRIDELREYAEKLDSLITDAEKRDRDATDLDSADLFAEPFPHILHSSLVIAVIAFVEAEVKGYCDVLRRTQGLKLAMGDLRGPLIKQFRLYVEDIAGVPLKLDTGLWQELSEVIALRHHFAHGLDVLGNAPSNAVKSLWKRSKSFDIDENKVMLSKRTSLFVIEKAKQFLEAIYEAALERYPR